MKTSKILASIALITVLIVETTSYTFAGKMPVGSRMVISQHYNDKNWISHTVLPGISVPVWATVYIKIESLPPGAPTPLGSVVQTLTSKGVVTTGSLPVVTDSYGKVVQTPTSTGTTTPKSPIVITTTPVSTAPVYKCPVLPITSTSLPANVPSGFHIISGQFYCDTTNGQQRLIVPSTIVPPGAIMVTVYGVLPPYAPLPVWVKFVQTPTSTPNGTTPAPIATLTVSPSSVEPGQSATVKWSASNVTSCTLTTGSIDDYSPTNTPLSGSKVVGPITASRTVILSCPGKNGTVAKQSVVINVTTPAPIATLTVSPSLVEPGQSATVKWSASNVTSCTLTTGSIDDYSPTNTPLSGSKVVGPITASRTVILSCPGKNGTVAKQSVVINVIPPAGVIQTPVPTAPVLNASQQAQKQQTQQQITQAQEQMTQLQQQATQLQQQATQLQYKMNQLRQLQTQRWW